MSARKRIVIAVVCAAVAALCMGLFATSVSRQASEVRRDALERYGGETASVCVTTRPVARGETFTERNVELREWLVDLLPEGALQDTGPVLGTASAADLAANTPLSEAFLDVAATSLDVPAGLTALAVPCSAQTAVGGALGPGTQVDLYVVSEGVASLLAEGALVLEASKAAASTSAAWVTVAVEPDLVSAVVSAASTQRLYLALPSGQEAGEA